MVPYTGPLLEGAAPLVKYVLEAGDAMVLGLSQCQREDFSHLPLMILHETVQVGHGVSSVRIVDEVIFVVPVVWWQHRTYRRGW